MKQKHLNHLAQLATHLDSKGLIKEANILDNFVKLAAGNTITINSSNDPKLNWYVGDSKMPALIDFLGQVGARTDSKQYTG